jgi:hypothetical protein
MQASKIQLGQTYAAQGGFDFRATGIITVKRGSSTTNYVEGVKLPTDDEIVEVKVEVKDIIDTAETHARLRREAEELQAKLKAEKQAAADKRAKATRLLAKAIGVIADPTGDYRVKGPKVYSKYAGIEVEEEALDALIAYLEARA